MPQDEELFSFYKKNGYEIFSRITEKEFSWEEISHFSGETAKLSPLSLGELKKLREEYFKEKGAVLWGSEHLSFALAEADYLGGGGFLIEIDGKYGYGIAHRSEEVLYIKEMALPKGKLMPVMKAVMEKYHVQSYQVRLCENSDTTEFLTRDFSMARFDPAFYIKEKGFYLNLVLD